MAFLSAIGLRTNSIDPDEVAHYEPPYLPPGWLVSR